MYFTRIFSLFVPHFVTLPFPFETRLAQTEEERILATTQRGQTITVVEKRTGREAERTSREEGIPPRGAISAMENVAVVIGRYRLSKTLGIGAFGKVKCEQSFSCFILKKVSFHRVYDDDQSTAAGIVTFREMKDHSVTREHVLVFQVQAVQGMSGHREALPGPV